MELHVTSREAAASLEELLDRVSSRSDTVTIERDGQPVAKLVAVEDAVPLPGKLLTRDDIAAVVQAVGRLDDGWADAVEDAVRMGNVPAESPWDR